MKLYFYVTDVFFSLIESLISSISGGFGRKIRYFYYKTRLKSLGEKVVFDDGVRIHNPQLVSIGENTWIDRNVTIIAGLPQKIVGPIHMISNSRYQNSNGEVYIGSNCHISINSILQGHGGLSIGDDSTVASGCMLYSMSHHYRNLGDPDDHNIYKFTSMVPEEEQSIIISPVVMEKYTALGLNSVILPGGTIGEGSWVGVLSVVKGTIPPYSIAEGNPAKVVKRRTTAHQSVGQDETE